jgi:aryl-alcohol dehydrogenase-like predicted oxidoreductase
VGLSNVTVDDIDVASRSVTVVTVQNRLNRFSVRRSTPASWRCATGGDRLFAYSPVGGGRLNKRLPAHPVLQAIGRRHAVSPHALVLAWVLAQGRTVIPIPSARTVEHALDSLSAAAVALSREEIAAITGAEFSRT